MTRRKKAQEVQFLLRGVHAQQVIVTGSFNDWDTTMVELDSNGDDEWEACLELEPGSYEYRYLADGEWMNDADAPRVPNAFGSENCLLEVE